MISLDRRFSGSSGIKTQVQAKAHAITWQEDTAIDSCAEAFLSKHQVSFCPGTRGLWWRGKWDWHWGTRGFQDQTAPHSHLLEAKSYEGRSTGSEKSKCLLSMAASSTGKRREKDFREKVEDPTREAGIKVFHVIMCMYTIQDCKWTNFQGCLAKKWGFLLTMEWRFLCMRHLKLDTRSSSQS